MATILYRASNGCRSDAPVLSFLLEPSLLRNVGPQPTFFCVQRPLQACGRRVAVPAPWARGQTTFPTVRVNCAHEALRRRDVAVCHPATGPPIRGGPRKGASRA